MKNSPFLDYNIIKKFEFSIKWFINFQALVFFIMEDVIIKYCNSYKVSKIEALLREVLVENEFFNLNRLSGAHVLLKPNLLSAHDPVKAITTHPALVEAVIRILKDYSCEISIGDSPNGVQKNIEDVWQKTGMHEICLKYDVKDKPFERFKSRYVDNLLISSVVLDADIVINIPKFKTHGLTVLTCAVKNMFGIVPGLRKAAYHGESKTREKFAEVLVRIAEVRKPDLNIVDGINSMAGNGPSGGIKCDTHFLALSPDMHSVDIALCNMLNLDPLHVDTIDAAHRLGLIDLKSDVKILGDIDKINFVNFKLPVSYTTNLRKFGWFNFVIGRMLGAMAVKPEVNKSKCIKCGMCVNICPVKCISYREGIPFINNKKCIGCFCCHEACGQNAINLRESLTLRLVKKITHR